MKITLHTLVALGMAVSSWPAKGQIYDTNNDVVETFAGSGFSGYVDGVGQLTMFNNPNAIAADSHGNLFVWDSNNYVIRKIAPDSTVTTFAGGSAGEQFTGVGTNVNFKLEIGTLTSMTIDHNNTVWMAATGGNNNVFGCVLYTITSSAAVSFTTLVQIISTGGRVR
jgi:hypothetical protein